MLKAVGILALVLLGFTTSYSQDADIENLHPSLKNAIEKLQSKGVDTLMVYYSYCIGCKSFNTIEECNDYGSARIVWKKNGKDFTQRVYCSKTDSEILETNSIAFRQFLNYRQVLTERKPLGKGKFYPPLSLHYFGEDFYLKIGKKWFYTNLHDDQRENKEWEKYSWILPTIKLSELNRIEMAKK